MLIVIGRYIGSDAVKNIGEIAEDLLISPRRHIPIGFTNVTPATT